MLALRHVLSILMLSAILVNGSAVAQNPLIMDQFTADPTARVFDGRVYVYPSHDVDCGTDWFCMKDYHVFSSENLVDWTDHGVIVSQEDVAWVDSASNSMWAPDAYFRDGTYYFYFPSIADTMTGFRGRAIGVATSQTPYGPFEPQATPIANVFGIDPNVFIDTDGQAYLYWSGRGGLLGARLKENMLELASEPQVIEEMPGGFKEGPFLFEREGLYYFTFPRVIEETEALVYAVGDHPLGPFEYKGIIMDEHPSGCWTNHHSIVEYEGQWYLFYHHNDLSPQFDKNRSIRADSLFFAADGAIQKVTPTLRGVGVVPSTAEIHVDRFSARSDDGASIAFLDTTDTFAGWKATLASQDGWLTFNRVGFNGNERTLAVRAFSETGGTLGITLQGQNGSRPLTVNVPAGAGWQTVHADIESVPDGVYDLNVSLQDAGSVAVDWVRFE